VIDGQKRNVFLKSDFRSDEFGRRTVVNFMLDTYLLEIQFQTSVRDYSKLCDFWLDAEDFSYYLAATVGQESFDE